MTINRRAVVQLVADTTGFQRSMGMAARSTGQLESSLGGAGGKFGKLGTVAAGAGIAVAGAMVGGVRAFAAFEDKLNQSLAIMGDVSEAMKTQMSDAAREVAKTTRISAESAAESYFFLASAGLNAEQSIAALPQVAAFAQAGMFDMATATDLATDAQSALGMTVKDPTQNLANLTKVTDVLVKANTLANASVQQFSEALTNKLGGSLRALNVPLEEGVAVLAAYADQGLKGAAAGEALGIMLRDLKGSATDNAEAFKRAGIEVFDSNGNFNNMADIVRDLTDAFGGLSVQEQTILAQQLGFQDRSFKNIQLLFGQAEAIERYEEGLRSAGGTTQEVADNQMESLSAQLDLIKSAFMDAGLEIGQGLAPALAELAPLIVDLAVALGPVASLLGEVGGGILGFLGKGAEGLKFMSQSVRGIFDESQAAASKMTLAVKEMNDKIEDGRHPATAFAESLEFLSRTNSLTAESLIELAEGADFVGYEFLNAIQMVRDLAVAGGQSQQSIDVLNEALYAQAAAAVAAGDAGEDLFDKLGLTDLHQKNAAESAGDLGDAAEGAADGLDAEGEAAEDLASKLQTAIDAQESLADVLKAAADPAFAAVKAWKEYGETLKEIDKDGKRSAEEQLELAEAILETQGALDALNGDALEDALLAIGTALGESREEVILLLQELGILDGTQVKALIEIDVQGNVSGLAGDLQAEANRFAAIAARRVSPQSGPVARAAGGPLAAGQAAIVGERGPELFIPTQAGTVIPNGVMSSKATTINFYNPTLTNDPVRAVRAALAFDSLDGSI